MANPDESRRPPDPAPPGFVILGQGRSGSGYIAAVLQAVGIVCGHEEWWTPDDTRRRGGLDGDSSWLAVGHPDDLPPVVLAQVRHPLAVVSSMLAVPAHGPWLAERERVCGTLPDDPLAAAMRITAVWCELVDGLVDDADVWPLEQVTPRRVAWIAERVGRPVDWSTACRAWTQVGPQNAHGPGRRLAWADLPDGADKGALLRLASHWGYQ